MSDALTQRQAARAGTPDALRRKNRELYDDTFGPVWRHAIFDGLHDGREFINLGGDALVRAMGDAAALTSASDVLELCSGPGAVAGRLLDLYGCAVTGVDINPRQVAHARAMADARPTSRLAFIEADACDWSPERTYDAVVSVDAFMLLAEPGDAIRAARLALGDHGRLVIATLTGGPALTDRFRHFANAMDGMVNLCADESYARWGADAGFARITIADITPMALAASAAMIASIARAKPEIVTETGADAYEGWLRVSEAYLDGFRSDQLRYVLVIGDTAVTAPRS